jgi:hypothetical protein
VGGYYVHCPQHQLQWWLHVIIWKFNSNGRYSVESLHSVISFRGIKQIYTPVMWKLTVPPRIHVFLWLVADNRLLTKDNLAKRKKLDDLSYLFCNEKESIIHLFFDCCVAKLVWGEFRLPLILMWVLILNQLQSGGLVVPSMLLWTFSVLPSYGRSGI